MLDCCISVDARLVGCHICLILAYIFTRYSSKLDTHQSLYRIFVDIEIRMLVNDDVYSVSQNPPEVS